MSFRDQLSKHENLLNKYKDLYLKENTNSNNSSKTSNQNINISRTSNNSNFRQNFINDDSNTTGNNIISNNTTTKNQEASNVLLNQFNSSDIQKSIEFNSVNNHPIGTSNSPSFQKNKNAETSLEKIDVLLSKLNQQKNNSSTFKSNNNFSKTENSKENDFDIKTDNKLKNIKDKNFNLNNQNDNINYRLNTNNNFNMINNNEITFQNIKEKYFQTGSNNFMGNTFGINNNFINTFQQQPKANNFFDVNDVLNKLDNFIPNNTEGNFFKNNIYNNNNNNLNNINSRIERLKAKYFSTGNDNFNIAIKQKDKEISILEKKLDSYKKKFSMPQKNILNIQSLKNNEEINNTNNINQSQKSKDINSINQNITNLLKESRTSQHNNISNNNITNNNITNNGEETINFSLSEDESMMSGYFKFKTSQEDKEYNYNDVLPLINKVSKLKEIRETEENNDEEQITSNKQSASEIANNIVNEAANNLINDEKNNEEDEKYKDIINKFKEEGKNNIDLFGSQLKLSGIKPKNENLDERPKIIRKNSENRKQGGKKIISFEEFLSKEDNDE